MLVLATSVFADQNAAAFLSPGLRETLLVLDDVWEASVAEAFERVGLSLLVTTRQVRYWARGRTACAWFGESFFLSCGWVLLCCGCVFACLDLGRPCRCRCRHALL